MITLQTSLPIKQHRIAVGAIFYLSGFAFASWASRIPDFKAALFLNEAQLGLILLSLPVGQLVSLPLAAWLIARYGSRAILLFSALGTPVILACLALSQSGYGLAAGLALYGLSGNLLNIAMNTQAVAVESLYQRSIMASFHGMWSLGGFSGAIVGGAFVANAFSPFTHFMTVLLICAAIVACSYRFTLREKEAAAKQSLFVKPDKQILVLGLIAFCCMVCEGAMADWSGVYFQKVVNAPVAFIPLGYIAFTCTMAGGRFLSDRLTTRYGVRPVLLTSGVLIASGLTLAILLPNLVSATTGMLLVGFGVSSVVPIAFGIAGRSTAMLPSTAIAAVSSISFLGFLVGPPLVGFLAQASSLKVSFMVLALLGLAISLIARKGSERLFR